MESIDYTNFNLPKDFQVPTGAKAVGDQEGISRFEYGEGMLPWRFANSARPWSADKVKKYRIDGADTVPVIMFYRDRENHHPVKLKRKMKYEERRNNLGEPYDKAIPVTKADLAFQYGGDEKLVPDLELWELPHAFDSDIFRVAYEKFKDSGAQKGTPLAAWRADPGQVNTLAALGVYTVEQYGRMSEEAVDAMLGQLPPSSRGGVKEIHELAVIYVTSQEGHVDVSQFGDKIEALESNNEKLKEELETQREKYEELLAKAKGSAAPKRKHRKTTKPSQPQVVDGVIEGIE